MTHVSLPLKMISRILSWPTTILIPASFSLCTFAVSAGTAESVSGTPRAETEHSSISVLYNHSSLTGNRKDWNEGDIEMLYRLKPNLIVGGDVSIRNRFDSTDTLYGASLSYYPTKKLELHGAASITPDASFSPHQIYKVGFDWRNWNSLSLLFDYERQNFGVGPINIYKPGVTYWFTDETYLTARYSDGRAFGQRNFDAYSLRLNLGISDRRRLVFGFAHGADPEKDPGVPGVILTTADSYSVYYHHPLHENLELIVGAEYEDRKSLYSRSTLTLGFSKRF